MGEGGGDTGAAAAAHEAGGASGPTKLTDDPPPTAPRAPRGSGVAGSAGDRAHGENGATGKAPEVARGSMEEQVVATMRAGQGGSRFGILGGSEVVGSGEMNVKAAGKRDVAVTGPNDMNDDSDDERETGRAKRARRVGESADETVVAVGMQVDSGLVVKSAQVAGDEDWSRVGGLARADKASEKEKDVLHDSSAKNTQDEDMARLREQRAKDEARGREMQERE